MFFSLAHFCVFPTDEWEDGYRPRFVTPSMGFDDFVKDVGVVLDHSAQGIRAQTEKSARQRKGKNSDESSELMPSGTHDLT